MQFGLSMFITDETIAPVALGRAAEDAGFDSVWLGDHLLYRDTRGESGPWDVWTQLAGLPP